jgi:beta-glucuronidase
MVRETLRQHLEAVGELIARDKNHASVLMWSVANEPASDAKGAATYFKHLVAQTRALDPTRPITFATFKTPDADVAAQYADVLLVNRYHAWYTNTGQLDIIPSALADDLRAWRAAHGKPLLLSEYGADAVAGVHADPPIAFSEEFQAEYLAAHFSTFDALRAEGVLVGEHVWNFADFMTGAGVTRVVGNRKGVFTRSRQPKLAARVLRERYHRLINESRAWAAGLAEPF